jgi:hypothetical protein
VIEAAVKVLPPSGADRAIAVPSEGGYFVAVADGAGGIGGGASAADRLIVDLTKLTAQAASADWWSVLLELDEELAGRGGVTAERICALATKGSVVKAADSLTACVRLPSGGLQDDVAVVIVG